MFDWNENVDLKSMYIAVMNLMEQSVPLIASYSFFDGNDSWMVEIDKSDSTNLSQILKHETFSDKSQEQNFLVVHFQNPQKIKLKTKLT